MLLDRSAKPGAVEHGEDLALVRELHRRRIVVTIAGHHPAAEPLGGDGEFAAQFAGAKQHESGKIHARHLAALLPIVTPAEWRKRTVPHTVLVFAMGPAALKKIGIPAFAGMTNK